MENTDLQELLQNMAHAKDVPDNRDYTGEELFGAVVVPVDLPRKASVNFIPFMNQGKIGACTVFGSSGALFNTMFFDCKLNGTEFVQPYDPWDNWAKAKLRGADDKNGWIIQAALKLQKDLGQSKGYANVGYSGGAVADVLKYWIWKGRAITTGSAYGDWSAVIKTNLYKEGTKFQGHCFQITEYDDDRIIGDDVGGFYCPNSWGGYGNFWISYKQIKSLFTQYIALGPADLAVLADLKNKRTQEYLVKSKGCWNAQNPNEIASDFEIATMVNRALNVIGNQKRSFYADKFSSNIIRDDGAVTIWNGKDANKKASDKEIAVMFTNSVTRSPFTKLVLKRIQVATVLGRDFF